MTTVYNDYYEAYDNKTMDITNVSFLVMLVDDSYTPKPSDKLDDVNGVIILVPYVITDDDVVTLSMGLIVDNSTIIIKGYIEMFPNQVSETHRENVNIFEEGEYIVVFNPSLNILCFCEKIKMGNG